MGQAVLPLHRRRTLEFTVHYIGISVAHLRVQKRFWEMTDDPKPKLLPKPNSTLIRSDDKVELHGSVPLTTSMLH